MLNTKNKILGALRADDLVQIQDKPRMRFDYAVRRPVEIAGEPIQHIYFPDNGFISVVAVKGPRHQIEIAMVGAEGMTGVPVVLGDDRTPNETYTQAITSGYRLSAAVLRSLLARSEHAAALMRRYALAFLSQTTQTALANGHARIEQRLARWLLMALDRLGTMDLPLTHELMALMLGVRRPGVTDALHRLEGEGLIRARRGAVTIRDREALEAKAGGFYGIAEAEYARLLS